MNIMLVEDDEGLSRGIPLALSGENDQFFCCASIREARKILQSEEIGMILLDIGLPDGDGLSFCREVRQGYQMPILFLTANDMEYDEVAGLNAGADDYITKPFSLAVLRSRIEAAKRRWEIFGGDRKMEEDRKEREAPGQIYQTADYRFSFEEQKFYAGNTEIFLSRTEQRLLYALVSNPGQVMERETLFCKIWGEGSAYLDENALSVAVGRLRQKLSAGMGSPPIRTVYGIGYKWMEKNMDPI